MDYAEKQAKRKYLRNNPQPKQQALSWVVSKMCRYGITIQDIIEAIDKRKGGETR